VVQPEAITVKGGPVLVSWKQTDKPARRVNLLCCQVQRDGKWCDLDKTEQRNERERIVLTAAEGREVLRLVMRLQLAADVSQLSPSLEPSMRQIERTIKALTNRRGEHNDRVKGLRKLATGSGDELAAMKDALSGANAALRIAEANFQATWANASRIYSSLTEVENSSEVIRARHAVTKAGIARDALAFDIRDYESQLPKLSRDSGDAGAQLTEVNAALNAEKLRQREAQQASQSPIRVKLGITIDGESIEVARIGPW
jgi:hypothetical protein